MLIHPDDYKSITADYLDLFNKKYSIVDLTFIIKYFNVSQTCLLTTQKLNEEFCNRYILPNEYSRDEADEYITHEDCLYYQKHLNANLLDY